VNQPNSIKTISIFTDAATSPQAAIAVGAFLYFDEEYIKTYAEYNIEMLTAALSQKIIYKKYQSKKSTWSEIKTVLDALDFLQKQIALNCQIEIYTDCQSLCDLLERRKDKLIKNHFMTRQGKLLQHAELYKELFKKTQELKIHVFKIKGHQSIVHRQTLQEKIFAILDKLSRKKLRSILYDKRD
jgi:ribonuclease HI